MSVGAVTARSHGGLVAANQNRAPRTAKIIQLRKTVVVKTRIPPSVSTRGLKHAIRNQQTKSLAQIARIVTGNVVKTVARSTPLSLAALIAAEYLYNRVVEPQSFPGFDNIAAVWRQPAQAPLGFEPGDFVPNPFDHNPTYSAPNRIALLDAFTCGLPFGCQYWGDFPENPYPDPKPASNWPTFPQWLPNPDVVPVPRPLPKPNIRPRHNPQRDLAPRLRPRPRWRPRNNITVSIRIPRPGAATRSSVRIIRNTPPVRGRDDSKANPANQFVYDVLLALANALGETKEWIDILASASGYDGNHSGPASIQKGHETVAKAWWLFVDQGINNVDFAALAVLVIENEIEDFVIGTIGQMSKSASRSLGLTTGLQTGPLL